MGQVWSGFRNKRNLPEEYLNRIIDTIFDRLPSASYSPASSEKKKTVTYEQLHEAILEVFKKINEISGSNWAPPSKESVVRILEDCDVHQNNEINREEFRRFVLLFKPAMPTYAREMLIVTVAIPAAATLTKMAIPVVGGLLSKVPNTVFYATATAAALLVRSTYFKK